MMAQRKVETWILWIVVDIICTVMYWLKGIQFFSLEYLIFTLMAVYGLINWIKLYRTGFENVTSPQPLSRREGQSANKE